MPPLQAKAVLQATAAANLVTPLTTSQQPSDPPPVPAGKVWKFRNEGDNDVAYRFGGGLRTFPRGAEIEIVDPKQADALGRLADDGKLKQVE